MSAALLDNAALTSDLSKTLTNNGFLEMGSLSPAAPQEFSS